MSKTHCIVIFTSDITVTSTLLRELNKVDPLNKTVVELQENNTALADKDKVHVFVSKLILRNSKGIFLVL